MGLRSGLRPSEIGNEETGDQVLAKRNSLTHHPDRGLGGAGHVQVLAFLRFDEAFVYRDLQVRYWQGA